MNRRHFFSSFATIAATAALDPERLLWVPGKKLISIPRPKWILELGNIVTFGSSPQRYIVTRGARSMAEIFDARLSMLPPPVIEMRVVVLS